MSKIQGVLIVVLVIAVAVLAVIIAVDPGSNPDNDDVPSLTPSESGDVLATDDSSATDDSGSEPTEGTEEPMAPLAGIVVCIDPGHQGSANSEKEPCAPWSAEANPEVNSDTMKSKCTAGATGSFTGKLEYVLTLEISMKIKSVLTELGATVVMTRESHDVNISNKERAQIGNDAEADVTLRIHGNSFSNPDVNGIEFYVRDVGDNTAEYKERSDYDYALAKELYDVMIAATGATSRGVKRSDSYTGTNWSDVPSIIIECGFMSNEIEDNKLASEEYQQIIADSVGKWLTESKILKG